MSKLKLPHASGNSMSIAAPATNPASDLELKLPATIGTAGQYLKNSSTAGTLEFGSAGTTSTDNYVCKAWCNLSGDSNPPSIRSSYNISSVTDHGAGDYTYNFTTAMANGNYICLPSGGTGNDGAYAITNDNAMGTGGVRVTYRTSRTSNATDFPLSMMAVWGVS